jgi:protein FrlC
MEPLQRYESNLCYNRDMLKGLIDAVDSPYLTACVDCVAMAAAGESIADYQDAFKAKSTISTLRTGTPRGTRCRARGRIP